MFSEQSPMMLVFFLLCFIGLLVMFFFIMRHLEELARSMREERAKVFAQLQHIDARLAALSGEEAAFKPAVAGVFAGNAGVPAGLGDGLDFGNMGAETAPLEEPVLDLRFATERVEPAGMQATVAQQTAPQQDAPTMGMLSFGTEAATPRRAEAARRNASQPRRADGGLDMPSLRMGK